MILIDPTLSLSGKRWVQRQELFLQIFGFHRLAILHFLKISQGGRPNVTSSTVVGTLLYKTKLRLKISCLYGDFKVILTMSVQTLVQNKNYTDVFFHR